ncbi:MAG: DNA recombination protein RmuC [Parcubacteria group bacterium]|nr:DNA recombination protein RmuC [Parcubacteria group bacterium]
MEFIFIAFIVIFIALCAVFFYFFSQKFNQLQNAQKDDKSLLMLQNQINELNRALEDRLKESHREMQTHYQQMQSQSQHSANIIKEVTERLTKVDETNRQVINFSDQLRQLQDILKNPKQRGVLGEYYLENLLKNVLPPGSYEMQYPFKDGTIVDAIIREKEKIIPIDSKFSLENYNRIVDERDATERERLEKIFKNDLKTRIDETAKYVKPDEGTMDFAFMFIPAEAIYYDLLVNQVGAIKVDTSSLIEYAFKQKKVIIVSPTSFLAYLQTVLQGLRALQIEESAKEIRKRVEQLGKHLVSYEEYMKKLGSHLGTAVNAYNNAYGEFGKIDKDVVRITGKESEIETAKIEGPRNEL